MAFWNYLEDVPTSKDHIAGNKRSGLQMLHSFATQSVIHRPAALDSLGDLLGFRVMGRSYPKTAGSKSEFSRFSWRRWSLEIRIDPLTITHSHSLSGFMFPVFVSLGSTYLEILNFWKWDKKRIPLSALYSPLKFKLLPLMLIFGFCNSKHAGKKRSYFPVKRNSIIIIKKKLCHKMWAVRVLLKFSRSHEWVL